GEQLPRWSLNLFWRRDGVPIWRDAALLASERDDHGATAEKAREFLHRLALRLGVDRRNVFAGYEDVGYYLWREGKLPINVEPTDSRLADKAERDRLRQAFERGLDEPVGYALPIAVDEQHPSRWRSTPWYLRNDHCFLVAGDSPLGFRLPLDSLPWARAADLPWVYPPDANVDLPPLPGDSGEAAARETRLTTEKFMLDGRHTGTGGGNHFVLGGATPGDSPFLRRPDLLASMIAYWHNHPALSYLFSGMFVGPTSQAPRIDEARNDSVYEIEIAFAELARVAEVETGKTPPWLIDRLLRNLLIDVTGNTHRAEFCIDKLYSPDGPTGRLGL